MSNEQNNQLIKCPECGEKIKLIPIQEPLPESTSTMTLNLTQSVGTYGGPSYAPTSRTYKCSNPKCWVTKVELSWS